MITSQELADRMIAEILYDVSAGVVPRSVKTFSELHEYVDANCYGGSEKLLDEISVEFPQTDEGHTAALNKLVDVMNPAMEIVNEWLENNGIAKGNPRTTSR